MIKDDLFKYEPTVMQSLMNALKSSRLAHTILLSGPKNPLKLKLAYLLSAVIVACEKEFPDDDDNTLRRIMSDDYPDVIYVDGNKATIKKEDIEKIFVSFAKTAFEGQNKVYILNNINNASNKVYNMLLKFMEEPRGDTYAILISDAKDSLLDTIVSRCVDLSFHKADLKIIQKMYEDDGFEREDAVILSNSLKEYRHLELNDINYLTAKDMVDQTMDDLLDPYALAAYFNNEIYNIKEAKGYDFKEVLKFYFGAMIYRLNKSLKEDDEAFKGIDLLKYMQLCLKLRDMASGNYDRKLLLDRMCFEMKGMIV